MAERDARESSALRPTADSLSPDELDLLNDPPKKPQRPIPVAVWLRVNGTAVFAEGECVEFTTRAVLIRWTPIDHVLEQAWVWANAVTRL